jgi:DNA-binding transcriptional LysR family regulator
VYEEVDHGQADLGLVSYPEESSSLAALPWRTETMVIVCNPQHPLTKHRSASLDMLSGEPIVAFQAGLKIREEIDRALALRKVRVRVALEFDNIETIKRAIEIGAGISLLPQPTIAREIESGTLVQIPLEGETLARPLGIIYRRDRKLNETAQQFIQLLQSQSTTTPTVTAPAEKIDTNGQSVRSREKVTAV